MYNLVDTHQVAPRKRVVVWQSGGFAMNWDAIGAVAELLGAIGVIVSLIYLAGQIRQNTRTQRRTNLGDIAIELAATIRCTATNSELASLVLRGHADLGSLDPIERFRYDNFMYVYLANFERALFDARSGDYPEEELVPMRAAIAGYLGTDGGHAWWEQRRTWFTLFGQQSIDEILRDQTIDSRGTGPVPVTQN
jgi:hypothetical protein